MTLPSKKIAFTIGKGLLPKKTLDFPFYPDLEKTPYRSLLGTKVYDMLWIQGGIYQDENKLPITYGGGTGNFVRFDTVLMTVSQTKNIITTALQGRDGTVKEYVSNGDYVINLRGKIVNFTNKYPDKFPTGIDHCDVWTLTDILKVPNELDVVSSFLNMFFNQMVITDFSMPQVEGRRNEQPFEINALSYTEIDLDVETQ